IVTIDDKPITKEEFEVVYQKNNTNLSDEKDVKSPEEYMEMFIDFKLKVREAENRGLDTTEAFRKEFLGYREELAKTYLTDARVTDSLIRETYNRTLHFVKVSHILINLDKNALPDDTLRVYNRMADIRKQILNQEISFEEAAVNYSDDPSVQENKGNLGYFSAFKMITPFEDACFTTPVGEITLPVRTSLGYHLIKVVDKIASKGEVKVAHIMKRFSITDSVSVEEDMRLKAEIDSLYHLLKNGEDFARLARECSDDKIAAKNNGEMRFINEGFFSEEFAKAAFALKNDGDYSAPIRTRYGWHIVKRLEHKPPKTFEESEKDIASKVKGDPARSQHSKDRFLQNVKKEYGFTPYPDNVNQFFSGLIKAETDSILPDDLPKEKTELVFFHFAGKDFTGKEYLNYVVWRTSGAEKISKNFLTSQYDGFEESILTNHEEKRLEEKYPDFKYLLQEYHDGILLFSVMESDVWNVALQDTVGLEKYYEQNKGKYFFGEHFDGLYIKCYNEDARKKADSLIAAGITDPDQLTELINIDGEQNIRIQKGKWERGSSRYVDFLVWKDTKPRDLDEPLYFMYGSLKDSAVKNLEEARGLYLSDYQDVIEKEWIKHLRDKYEVSVNKRLLKKVKSLKKR
ncbi:MAG TPA: peptidylprolyl isomerase, partial [Prolixibacteraceae bacterium]|nr:peptidylprolyl isomerase [Prolixibacteraceae bacterium]